MTVRKDSTGGFKDCLLLLLGRDDPIWWAYVSKKKLVPGLNLREGYHRNQIKSTYIPFSRSYGFRRGKFHILGEVLGVFCRRKRSKFCTLDFPKENGEVITAQSRRKLWRVGDAQKANSVQHCSLGPWNALISAAEDPSKSIKWNCATTPLAAWQKLLYGHLAAEAST